MAVVIGTVTRQHPLLDIDFHGRKDSNALRQLFTTNRIRQAIRIAGDRMFITTGEEEEAKIMRPGRGDGIHAVALGYTITQDHKRVNAEFVRQVHRAFDELLD